MLGLGLNIFTLAIRRYFGGGGGRFAGSSLNLDFTSGNQSLDPRITFTRASTGTRVNASGVLVSEAIDGPRFDYDPVTLQPKGLLIEEQRTNLLTYSSEFDNGVWGKARSVVMANVAIAPDGTLTADKLADDGASVGIGYVGQNATWAGGVTYTGSFYVKAEEYSSVSAYFTDQSGITAGTSSAFNLSSGTVTSGAQCSIQPVGDGWYRVAIYGSPAAGSGTLRIVLTTDTASSNGLYLWGAQLEAGAFPTSYIPTTTAAATRAADVAVITGANFSNWYRQDEGTLFAEASVLAATTDAVVASLNNGTTSEDSRLRALSSGSSLGFRVFAAGASQAFFSVSGQLTPNAVFRSAGAYKIDDFAFSANGSAALTDSSGFTSTATLFSMGNIASVSYLNGHIRKIAYFPRRLTNSELQGITK